MEYYATVIPQNLMDRAMIVCAIKKGELNHVEPNNFVAQVPVENGLLI
jgi:hypothetical protein